MAKKKKLLKKLAKAAIIGGGLYAAAKGLKGAKGNVSKTAAMEDIITRPPRVDDYNYKPKKVVENFDPNFSLYGAAKGGRIGKKGGHVKSMGIAKRGGGVAKR